MSRFINDVGNPEILSNQKRNQIKHLANVEAVLTELDNNYYIVIYAKRRIITDEELILNYGNNI